MGWDPRVQQLLEELLESDKTPEEVCRSFPELLSQVRKRWEALRNVQTQIGLLFPSPGSLPGSDQRLSRWTDGIRIPGYEVQEQLGCGGMGVVYKAWHLRLNRQVALKMLLAGAYASREQRERFLREAEAVAALRHPNIVQIYHVGDHEGLPYFTMEFIEGGTLASQLSGIPQPARRAAAVLARLAEAVHAAHQGGIVHRDLKPANVLLTTDGIPKITDFGVARRLQDGPALTQTGVALGTPSYMAPEQIRARAGAVGPTADVYSLGAILYEMLTGRPPFRAETAVETEMQALNQEAVPPSRLNAKVPRDLETICLKCLQKDPQRRYGSAAELAADLERFLQHRPIRARPVGFFERLARWSRRNPSLAALASALLFTAVIGFAAVFWQWRKAEAFARAERIANVRSEQARLDAEQAGAVERWQRYCADVAAASAALQLQRSSMAERALDDAPGQHRNWEWSYLHNQLDNARAVLPGILPVDPQAQAWERPILSPSGEQVATLADDGRSIRLWNTATGTLVRILHRSDPPVRAIVFRPDGKQLALGCRDNSVRLWNLATATEAAVLRGHGQPPRLLAYRADGRRLLSQAIDGVRLWDTESGRAIAAIATSAAENLALFSEDGRRLIVSRGREVSLWDTATGRQIAVVGNHERPVLKLAISPDGRRIASRGDHEELVRLWDAVSGRQVAALRGHTVGATTLAFSPDGSRLASGSPYPDDSVRLWDATSGRALAVMQGHQNTIWSVTFSADGRRIVSASMDGTARLWDAVTGQPGFILRGHSALVTSAIFSPDGERVVTCSEDRTLRLWDTSSGDTVAVLRGHTHEVTGARFVSAGKLLVSTARDGEARVWDMELAERNGVLHGHQSFVYDVAFSPDDAEVASVAWDGTVRLWNATTGRPIAALRYDHTNEEETIVTSVAWHPGGRQLASVARNDTITLWDLMTGKARRVFKAPTGWWTGDCRAVFNRAGTLLAAGSRDGSVRIWDVTTGRLLAELRGHRGSVVDVAFSPDGTRLVSVGLDATVRLWDVASGAAVASLLGDREGYRVAYSLDGRLFAASSLLGRVRLWDAAAFREIAVLQHGGKVYGLAFSADSMRLATGCSDNTIHLWDIASRTGICELRGHTGYVHAVTFSHDGTRLASASGDQTVRIWDSVRASERARGSGAPAAQAGD